MIVSAGGANLAAGLSLISFSLASFFIWEKYFGSLEGGGEKTPLDVRGSVPLPFPLFAERCQTRGGGGEREVLPPPFPHFLFPPLFPLSLNVEKPLGLGTFCCWWVLCTYGRTCFVQQARKAH